MSLKMRKLVGLCVVLAAVAAPASFAVGGEEWTCNTTCLDTHGFEYIQVSYGGTPSQAYDNLSCKEGDTVSGDINCWENLLLD